MSSAPDRARRSGACRLLYEEISMPHPPFAMRLLIACLIVIGVLSSAMLVIVILGLLHLLE